MTEIELSDYLNYSAEIKLLNREPFKGVILRANEFERENTKYIYINNKYLKKWEEEKLKKNKPEMLKYQKNVEISEIEWIKLLAY